MLSTLFLLSINLKGQAPDSLWQYHFGGANDEIGFDAIEAEVPGEYILVGKTKSFGNGMNDGYLLRLGNDGGKIWEKYYGGDFDEQLISICPAHGGGYAMTGFFKSFPEGGTAVWVLFINEQGDSILSKTYATQHDCWGLHISPTGDEGYIVSGVMATGFGVGDEVWLLKLDAAGDTTWTRRYGNPNQDYGEEVIQTSDGGYIIAGRTYSSYTPESCDAWVIKTDANGDTLWTKKYGGNDEDMFNSVVETNDGFIFAGNAESYRRAYSEFWAVRTDDNGDTLWSRTYGSGEPQLCFSISETSQGHYVLGGYSGLLSTSFDTYLMKINDEGNLIWEAGYGHPQANEIMYGFSPTTDGGFIAAGHTTYFTSYKDELVALKLGPAGSGMEDIMNTTQYSITNFPNPFHYKTIIHLSIPYSAKITLDIFNSMGVYIQTLIKDERHQGNLDVEWNCEELPAGLYFCRLVTSDGILSQKMMKNSRN